MKCHNYNKKELSNLMMMRIRWKDKDADERVYKEEKMIRFRSYQMKNLFLFLCHYHLIIIIVIIISLHNFHLNLFWTSMNVWNINLSSCQHWTILLVNIGNVNQHYILYNIFQLKTLITFNLTFFSSSPLILF